MAKNEINLLALATLEIYRECLVKASRDLKRNWVIIVGSVLSYLAFMLLQYLIGGFGILAGFISGFAFCALVSNYYRWLECSIERERLRFSDLLQFDYPLFSAVISVAFILWIVQFISSQLIQGLNSIWIIALLNLGIALVFNSISEVIYIARCESTLAFSRAAAFTQENWIEWFLPQLLILSPGLFLTPIGVLMLFTNIPPLLPALPIISVIASSAPQFLLPYLGAGSLMASFLIGIILAIILANWFMLFRAHLFKALESGTRRQRIYRMRNRS